MNYTEENKGNGIVVRTYADGTKEWWLNGQRHRADGPAIERADGSNEWWLNGELHRADGPAYERADGSKREEARVAARKAAGTRVSPLAPPAKPLSDVEFKKLVGRMSLPQLYDALKANGVKLEGIGLEPKKVGNKYHRTIHGVSEGSLVIDVYNVLEAFGVTCPACQHAIKKLLCAGLRNKGSRLQDLNEAAESASRAVTLEK